MDRYFFSFFSYFFPCSSQKIITLHVNAPKVHETELSLDLESQDRIAHELTLSHRFHLNGRDASYKLSHAWLLTGIFTLRSSDKAFSKGTLFQVAYHRNISRPLSVGRIVSISTHWLMFVKFYSNADSRLVFVHISLLQPLAIRSCFITIGLSWLLTPFHFHSCG